VASLQLGLSLIWTEAKRRGVELPQVMEWMAANPAALAGLNRKGKIALGCDADFAIFEPESAQVVDVNKLHHKNPITPYDGRALAGVVTSTWLRGEKIDFQNAHGRMLRRGDV
ncbi:amidohydrolase family protein, partial [Gordonia sp. HY442]